MHKGPAREGRPFFELPALWNLSKERTMKRTEVYEDLDGNAILLSGLDSQERVLISRLRRRANANPDWNAFDNYWTTAVAAFYERRGLKRKAIPQTVGWRVAQDLSSRLGIAQGYIRPTDYRTELEDLVRTHYPSRRAFCQATGLSEDMLCHVLAGRKDLSLSALTEALGRIGYGLRIVPAQQRKRTG
jgi:hypothetical protein